MPVKPAPRKATFGIIAAEFSGGLLGGAGGAMIGGLSGISIGVLFWGVGFDVDFDWSIAILGTIYGTFGSAGSTCLAGACFNQGGRFLPTLAGATLGAGVGWSVVLLSHYFQSNPRNILGTLVPLIPTAVMSSVGASIGYNLSRESVGYSQVPIWNRFDLPSFSFRTERTKEYKTIPVYDFRLVNARF